jgi:hypothetical protein
MKERKKRRRKKGKELTSCMEKIQEFFEFALGILVLCLSP